MLEIYLKIFNKLNEILIVKILLEIERYIRLQCSLVNENPMPNKKTPSELL